MALKCADLGHLAASWAVHQKWVAGLEEELFRQGDLEQQLSLPISPLMDRAKGGITKSQASSQLGTSHVSSQLEVDNDKQQPCIAVVREVYVHTPSRLCLLDASLKSARRCTSLI